MTEPTKRVIVANSAAPGVGTRFPRRLVGGGGLAAIIFLILPQGAWGRPPQAVETQPVANSVVGRRPAQYVVRFDAPVDHYRSRLLIARSGQVVVALHILLDAAPEVLFGTAPALEPGEYELRWEVVSLTGVERGEGSVPFTVRP